jgi:hypothetical protein
MLLEAEACKFAIAIFVSLCHLVKISLHLLAFGCEESHIVGTVE